MTTEYLDGCRLGPDELDTIRGRQGRDARARAATLAASGVEASAGVTASGF
jgi:hypothetical protein